MKLSEKDRVFWRNFFQALLTYVIASVLLSMRGGDDFDPHFYLDLKTGFTATAFLCVPILCGMIAMRFASSVNPAGNVDESKARLQKLAIDALREVKEKEENSARA